MKQVVIVGAGNQARVAQVLLSKDTEYEVAAFTVHEAYVPDEPLLGLDVVPFESIRERYPPDQFALCIAMGFARVNKVRAAFYEESIEKGYEVISYVSSKAVHWGEFEIGNGSFVFENAVVHPWVSIGNNVSIGPGCILGHDVVVGDHCFIAPGTVVLGCAEIEPYCFIGANATLRDGVRVARECVIGAGANILEDTVERGVYAVKSTPAADTTSDLLSPFFGMPRR